MKRWADNDLVYDDDLSELVTSANLTFANAAARDAFLVGSIAPVPGTTVYMKDDGITYTYVMVGGTGSWAPAPGTLISGVGFGSTYQSMGSAGVPTLVAIPGIAQYSRNLNNAYNVTTSRFNPQVPGIYEISGQVASTVPAPYDGYRSAWLCLNNSVPGSADASTIPGSRNQFWPSVSVSSMVTVATKEICCYLNGSSDYVTLWAMHSASAGITIGGSVYATNAGSSYYDTSLTAKYLGM